MTAKKGHTKIIALRDQVEAEITDRQAGLLEQAKAEKEEEQGNIEECRE